MERQYFRKFLQVPTSTVPAHLDTNTDYTMVDALEEKTFMVATLFTGLMDNPHQRSSHVLSEDAVMDWFGRTLKGRDSIIKFIRINLPKMHHKIETITGIPPINHGLLKHFINGVSPSRHKPCVEECGQGDCKGKTTPTNTVYPNLEELVKAPRKKMFQYKRNPQRWLFSEIKGQLEFDYSGTSGHEALVIDKNFNRIVLGYTDEVHLIVYEGKSLCRKKLFPLFKTADE